MRNALYLMRSMPPDDPEAVKTSEILERQVNHLVRIVEDLMDVARLERGKLSLRKERLDLNDVVAAAVETCLAAAQARGHRIIVQLSQDVVPIDADAVRIEQIVSNLVNNAIKFSPEPGEIRVETAAQDGFAMLAVEDGGVGFEPGVAATLFDPFLQVNPTLERSSGGLGVGLTIVRRLAEMHGGSAEAESGGVGRGARFVVRLPLAPADALAPPEGAAEQAPARPRRVVVVDDNPDIRESLRLLFTLWGHDVSLAPDGPSGLDLVLKERPDVALVDVGLPGMNGYDVARAVRRALPSIDIRLVALTGYGQPDDVDRALQAGFDTHLLKPIDPKVLARSLLE
jgi:CheY-like chemotaxis protein